MENEIKKVGDVVTVKADDVLGTDAFKATVVAVTKWGYYVAPVDQPGWEGPVNFNFETLQEMP